MSWFGKLGGVTVRKRFSWASVFILMNLAAFYVVFFLVVSEVI